MPYGPWGPPHPYHRGPYDYGYGPPEGRPHDRPRDRPQDRPQNVVVVANSNIYAAAEGVPEPVVPSGVPTKKKVVIVPTKKKVTAAQAPKRYLIPVNKKDEEYKNPPVEEHPPPTMSFSSGSMTVAIPAAEVNVEQELEVEREFEFEVEQELEVEQEFEAEQELAEEQELDMWQILQMSEGECRDGVEDCSDDQAVCRDDVEDCRDEPECRDEAEDWHEDDGDDQRIDVEDEEEERERMINESQGIIQRYLGQAAVQRSGKRVRSPSPQNLDDDVDLTRFTRVIKVDVDKLRYSQASIKPKFQDGRSVSDLIQALLNRRVSVSEPFLRLSVFEDTDRRTNEIVLRCKDNRRLLALKQYAMKSGKQVMAHVNLFTIDAVREMKRYIRNNDRVEGRHIHLRGDQRCSRQRQVPPWRKK